MVGSITQVSPEASLLQLVPTSQPKLKSNVRKIAYVIAIDEIPDSVKQ
jgi:hypothetical protein